MSTSMDLYSSWAPVAGRWSRFDKKGPKYVHHKEVK